MSDPIVRFLHLVSRRLADTLFHTLAGSRLGGGQVLLPLGEVPNDLFDLFLG